MPRTRAVFLKQSGELLEQEGSDGHWRAAHRVAERLAEAYKKLPELRVSGLTVVTGAGNIARGESLKNQGIADKYADAIGRWGTIGNSIVLAGALEALNVPISLLISDKMAYGDQRLDIQTYSPQALKAAHDAGRLVIIAGGTGEDNVTTDNAVVFYAGQYRQVFDGEIMVLKGTKYDGVYESDPAKTDHPVKYLRISAHTMRENYDQFKVVDRKSLDQLISSGLSMLIYSDNQYSLREVLSGTDQPIGTEVVPERLKPLKQQL